jgi:hypothetical protein
MTLSSIAEFRAELERALARARELAGSGRPSMLRIQAELEDLDARTREPRPPPPPRSYGFDVIAARELDGLDDAYADQLARLAAFVRDWPA